jgi:predicted RNase H-like HicB family nuclease
MPDSRPGHEPLSLRDKRCPWYPALVMGGPIFHVQADWDHEAGVWVATSDDVPGLATEAPTIEALAEKLRIMIPELLEANQLLSSGQTGSIGFELTSHRQERVRLAS